jgi:hypothetical protein
MVETLHIIELRNKFDGQLWRQLEWQLEPKLRKQLMIDLALQNSWKDQSIELAHIYSLVQTGLLSAMTGSLDAE